ncbi:MAG: D-tyrosyl-tRNA(Tyr) deacylase [Candidatus Hydrogenedentes bacterium]|nr:D-tyrosyl-tRNA(Tyr) deacylase [Candidatus Hydrogenedentota bacterium]
MRVVLQRVSSAAVRVDDAVVGEIGPGLVALIGVDTEDVEADAAYMAEKIAHIRLFRDDEGRMNRSVLEVGGSILAISQFTLHGDCRRGRRPSFVAAAAPETAVPLYESVMNRLRKDYGLPVAAGIFGAHMELSLVNDGPVTILLDSRKCF